MRQRIVTIATCLALSAVAAAPVAAQQLQLPDLSKLSNGAIDVVDVTVDQALLGLAAGFMSGSEEADAKALIAGLKGIYVKSFTYGKDGAYDPTVLDSVRRQLSGGQWSRLVAAKSVAEGSDVAVYLWRNGEKLGGLAVLSAGPREVTVVNIVGAIDLEQLRSLEGKFGVPAIDVGNAGKGQKGKK